MWEAQLWNLQLRWLGENHNWVWDLQKQILMIMGMKGKYSVFSKLKEWNWRIGPLLPCICLLHSLTHRFSPATCWPPQTLPLPSRFIPLCPLALPPAHIELGVFDWWLVCSHLLTLVLRTRIFLPWRWRRYVPPKRRFNPLHLNGATPQKNAFFIVTAVKTSNLTYMASHPRRKHPLFL
jgi:hypothetical protein